MGPLTGFKIIELAGVGPAPICAMLLADLGASVLRIERTVPVKLGVERPVEYNLILRNREMIALDLKKPQSVALVLDLVDHADGLIEGFRPGVTERLGLGPAACHARNPKLVYGRVTGWGQDGPLAHTAGHDLNYIAITGILAAMGRNGQLPTPPLNLVGDFAGGGLYLALGILAGLLEAQRSGKGQTIDSSIMDGAASMMMQFFGMKAAGLWGNERGTNVLDSGAPFYDVYPCADGRLISIAPIEDKFFSELMARLDLPPACLAMKGDRARWPELREILARTLATRSLAEWVGILEGGDSCFAPVLDMDEAQRHPQIAARETFITVDGVVQPRPMPAFSRTVPDRPRPPRAVDPQQHDAILRQWLPPDVAARHAAAAPQPVAAAADDRG